MDGAICMECLLESICISSNHPYNAKAQKPLMHRKGNSWKGRSEKCRRLKRPGGNKSLWLWISWVVRYSSPYQPNFWDSRNDHAETASLKPISINNTLFASLSCVQNFDPPADWTKSILQHISGCISWWAYATPEWQTEISASLIESSFDTFIAHPIALVPEIAVSIDRCNACESK